jgi:hypothetical protein
MGLACRRFGAAHRREIFGIEADQHADRQPVVESRLAGEVDPDFLAETAAGSPRVAEADCAEGRGIAVDDGACRAAVEARDAELEGRIRRCLAGRQASGGKGRGAEKNPLHASVPLKTEGRCSQRGRAAVARIAHASRPSCPRGQVPFFDL